MGKAGWRAETLERKMNGGALTLEKYHRFFADPWGARITIDHLNQIISMHGFVKLHGQPKRKIMNHLVGQVDLQPPCRSTLHTAARLSAANVVAEQAAADVDAIGWTECPIGCVSVFAGYGEDPSEPLEPMPPPADHVLSLAVRRARSKRTRGSAYPRRAASEKAKVKEEDMEEAEIWQPPPSPPPLWMRSPTPPPPSPPPLWMRFPPPPPPPPSPPRPETVAPPSPSSPCWVQPKLEPILAPPPGYSSPPPAGYSSPPPPGFGSPQPPGFGSPPQRCRPTLAPLPTPPSGFVSPPLPSWNQPMLPPQPGFGSPQVTPPPPQLSWGLPLPMVPPPSSPGAPPTFTDHRQRRTKTKNTARGHRFNVENLSNKKRKRTTDASQRNFTISRSVYKRRRFPRYNSSQPTAYKRFIYRWKPRSSTIRTVPRGLSPPAPPTGVLLDTLYFIEFGSTYNSQPAGPPPLWRPTVPPSYPAPCWGAPSVLPPPQVPWRWPHPPPRWAPPHMLQQQRPPPPWGCMPPSAPPTMPPQHPGEQHHTPQPPCVSWARPRPVF